MRTSPAAVLVTIAVFTTSCGDPVVPLTPPTAASRAEHSIGAAVGPSPVGSPIAIGVQQVETGFVSPVLLVQAPGKDGHRFVIDQIGKLWELNPAGQRMPEPFLDITSKLVTLSVNGDERGLLGLAFHPEFVRNGRFFVFYTAPPLPTAPAGYNNTTTIAEYVAHGGGEQLRGDVASEKILLQVDHPQANHNGGTIAFGPDGYLYISIGDGGGRDDEAVGHVPDWYEFNAGGNGQDIEANLLGNILRIDVNHGPKYGIPLDNPFVGQPGLDEIWAYGFRNPYRFSFDMGGSRALIVGDAGQELWEEASVVERRGNYGWNVKEGTHCFDAAIPTVSPESCPSVDPTTGEALRDPVIEFANVKQPGGLGNTIIGGNVYRAHGVSGLVGSYIFGSAVATTPALGGRLFASLPQSGGLWPIQELLINGADRLGYIIKGFGQDKSGDVYVMATKNIGPTGTTGTVFKIVGPDAPSHGSAK
ncbi:MAG: PQQ-dependent sugar dehydrogenase [Gemmatimonadaceae bacterium]